MANTSRKNNVIKGLAGGQQSKASPDAPLYAVYVNQKKITGFNFRSAKRTDILTDFFAFLSKFCTLGSKKKPIFTLSLHRNTSVSIKNTNK